MRVGIITIPDFDNYGNRLQNYALQTALQKIGCEPISYVPFRPTYFKYFIKKLLRNESGSISETLSEIHRMKSFLVFDRNFVKTEVVKESVFNKNLAEQCDYFVAGSDQIWNPNWGKYLYENMFLRFANRNQRIAYAPSFGVNTIPVEWIEKYAIGLKEFSNLSVREDRGALIVKELIQQDVPVVLDPTMLLSEAEWIRVAKMPTSIKKDEKYILTYFLGEISNDCKEYIENLNTIHNFKIYSLLDKSDKKLFETGPSEFLALIYNAELVLTDSFHASVFSIIFKKSFIVFPRKGMGEEMSSRLTTLLEKFSLTNRMYPRTMEEIFELHLDHVDEVLEVERKRSYQYLKAALNK